VVVELGQYQHVNTVIANHKRLNSMNAALSEVDQDGRRFAIDKSRRKWYWGGETDGVSYTKSTETPGAHSKLQCRGLSYPQTAGGFFRFILYRLVVLFFLDDLSIVLFCFKF
jgi:hypothetical protein